MRCFVNAPSKWLVWLPLVEFWYNCCPHSAIGISPFVALYGHPPRQFRISEADAVVVPELSVWLQERQVMTELIKKHIHCAKMRMKKQADRGRSERHFKVGDNVFLKLQPYVQSSLAPRSNKKLSFKYFGPYKVVKRIGQVAYQLEFPPHSSIHPIFHVSQLKKAIDTSIPLMSDLPSIIDVARIPEVILSRRVSLRSNRQVNQVLVRWSGISDDMATWEDLDDLKRRFPLAPAWGQAASQEGGML